jgi:LacI family transcriptional regulator
MGITSTQLAALCGVSRATVDRVLNNRGRVSPLTRNMVLNAAKKYDYRPDYIGKSLSKGKTYCIGIAVPNLKNQFFSLVLDQAANTARARGYAALVSLYEDDPECEYTSIQNLLDRKVDGLVIFPTGDIEKTAGLLKTSSIPSVTILNSIDGFTCIAPDYMAAMYDAALYVIGRGYTNLMFLCPPLNRTDGANTDALLKRKMGFLNAIESVRPKSIEYSILTGYDNTDAIIKSCKAYPGRSAVLCSSDIYALELMSTLPEKGISIPEDIGIMGFDGLDMLKYVRPVLATVLLPISLIGRNAADHLIDMITGAQSNTASRIPHNISAGQTLV